MKLILLALIPLAALGSACGVTSPVNDDPDDHQEVVENSRRDGTVVISLDTIFDTGVPHAVIRSAPKVLPGRVKGVGSEIFLLSGVQAVRIIPEVLYGDHYLRYELEEGGFATTAYLGYQESILSDARTVVGARLLTRDSINRNQALAFALLHPKPAYRAPRRGEMVTRDRDQAITLGEGEVWQTGLLVGRYDTASFALGGARYMQVSLYYVDSVHCATITHGVKPGDSVAAVYTVRDRRSYSVDGAPPKALLKTVVEFLVAKLYL